jgi:Tol biopolymer transport system component
MDNTQLTPLRKRNPKISRRFATALEKAMAVDPSDRFQSAEDFKKALVGTSSKTQQLAGGRMVAPPPPEAFLPNDPNDAITFKEKTPRPPVAVVPAHSDDQPFVSPLKKQKERERKRRFALIRFVIIMVLLLLVSVSFWAPGILSTELRASIPFLAPTSTATPSITPSPLPTQTFTATATSTSTIVPTPTATATALPTNTSLPAVIGPVGVDPTLTATAAATANLSVTPVGGSGQIAYVSNRTDLPQIYLADLASLALVQITNMPEGACQPSWSPDGKKLVFTSPCKGMDEIYYGAGLYIMNADGSGLTPIGTVPGGDFDPSWSPDGKSIAFTSLRSGQMEIFIISADDLSSINQVTKGVKGVESRQPAWSPDGTRIVYVVKRFGVYQIWLMNADGAGQKQIVRSGVAFSDYLPTWSPDGNLILFNQRCATKFCFPYLMTTSAVDRSVEQGAFFQLKVISIENVEYSPDGFSLLYEGEAEGENNDIFYMTVTGANNIRITTDTGLDFDPAWRPGGN